MSKCQKEKMKVMTKAEGLTVPDFNTYNKAIIIKMMWY
jgi:hypothetical protein